MNRRRFLLYSGSIVMTLGGCLTQEQSDTPDRTSKQTTARTKQDTDERPTETMQPTGQHLVFVNMDDEQHTIRVTVNATDDSNVFDRTVDLAADERRKFLLGIDKPGKYTVSVTIDEDTTETTSVSFDDYDIEEGSDVFIEINDGRSNIYWEE